MAPRTRLSPEDRRAQLLALGARLFADQPYEDVHIEQVADMAQVSRGLLYRYFPSKRAFFAALVEIAATQLGSATTPQPGLSPYAQLVHGIERYLDHCRANPGGVRAIHHGSASADPDVLAVIEESTALHVRRILDVLSPDAPPHPLAALAVRAWITSLREASSLWIETDLERDDVRDACAGALVGALAALPDGARPDAVDVLLRERQVATDSVR